ncbi:MAG: hypothetical protein HYT27_01905 [Parcubacteria group bacterium]|nr:hypothetical protein [Parcubacteria group bacterium]
MYVKKESPLKQAPQVRAFLVFLLPVVMAAVLVMRAMIVACVAVHLLMMRTLLHVHTRRIFATFCGGAPRK